MTFQDILFTALGTIITGLATWGTSVLIQWLNSKIKNKEIAALAATILTVITHAVKATYQSYVQSIKGTNLWTKEAQEEALRTALETAKAELTTEALAYIQAQHGDIDKYITTIIESVLYDLKNGNSKNITVETNKE